MQRIALVIFTASIGSQALAQVELCQSIATAYVTDNELKDFSVPLRRANAAESALWPSYSECKSFPVQLGGYFEHQMLPMPLLSIEVQTGMRVSYTEILKAPPDCSSRDWKKRYGDALFNFNNRSGLLTKLLVIEGTPIFVIGGFGKNHRTEGLTEAILVNDGNASKACSFARMAASVAAERGTASVCAAYRNETFLRGDVTQTGRSGKYELAQHPGVIKFRQGQADEVVLRIEYTNLADTHPIQSISIEGKTFNSSDVQRWQQLIASTGFNNKAPQWILLADRPTAVQQFPMRTVISWPDTKMETCVLDLVPRYGPEEPLQHGGVQLGEAIGP